MSKIEWTEQTWNPVVGCRRVSPGCDNCYAILEAHRKKTIFPHYADVTEQKRGRIDWTGRFSVAPDHIFNKPLRTSKATMWFVNSMSDLFGEGVPDDVIKRVFEIMQNTQRHTYQVLTKRPNRAVRLADELPWPDNVWLGVSIEEDKFAGRADLLRKIPAQVRFISAEPLLGPLPSLDLDGIDWLIVGGESGHSRSKVRRMDQRWARDLQARCAQANTLFFFKQWGNWDKNGGWHRSKKDAGRQLDGREWNEMPPATAYVAKVVAASVVSDALRQPVQRPRKDKPRSTSARVQLRRPIWEALKKYGSLDAETLRAIVLPTFKFRSRRGKLVNLHAWALVDLQKGGWIARSIERRERDGRERNVSVYRVTRRKGGPE